jgi:pilus assembly protein CpaE
VLAAPEDPAHASDVKREHIESIVRLARSHYDFVILDVSRSLDGVSLQALDMADTIFPVLQLTLPYVRDGKRLLSIFRSLEYPRSKIQLVVNRYEKGSELSLQDLEKAVDAKVSHVVPNSYAAAAASVNLGIPIIKANRGNPISKFLIEMGREFVPAEIALESGGWLSRMLSRPRNSRFAGATNGIDRG